MNEFTCNICGRKFSNSKVLPIATMYFDTFNLTFCPECAMKIIQNTNDFKNMTEDHKQVHEEFMEKIEKHTEYY